MNVRVHDGVVAVLVDAFRHLASLQGDGRSAGRGEGLHPRRHFPAPCAVAPSATSSTWRSPALFKDNDNNQQTTTHVHHPPKTGLGRRVAALAHVRHGVPQPASFAGHVVAPPLPVCRPLWGLACVVAKVRRHILTPDVGQAGLLWALTGGCRGKDGGAMRLRAAAAIRRGQERQGEGREKSEPVSVGVGSVPRRCTSRCCC